MTSTVIRVARDSWSRYFDPSLPPAAQAKPGDQIIVQTYCCSMGAVDRTIRTTPETFHAELGYTQGMPITGPIGVPDAQVGDTLVVEILKLEVADSGWTMVFKGRGALGHRLETAESRVIPIVDGVAIFDDRVRLPVRPMIGCIGTTPANGPLRAGWPGPHGGNMDCKLIGQGATVFLPVLIPGAHLALGDIHALMGDGEVGVAGLEIAGEVTIRLRLLRRAPLPLPLLETPNVVATIYSAEDLDAAASGAIERMADLLVEHAGLSMADAAMLLSLGGDLRICQVVNALMTCRMEMPKAYLQQLGVDLASLCRGWEVQARAGQGQ